MMFTEEHAGCRQVAVHEAADASRHICSFHQPHSFNNTFGQNYPPSVLEKLRFSSMTDNVLFYPS